MVSILRRIGFSALQRAEIAEMERDALRALQAVFVSVLFNEPKLLKCKATASRLISSTVSVLFNEPKLLKSVWRTSAAAQKSRFSALQRAEIAEIAAGAGRDDGVSEVSVLFNEPKLLK